MTGYGLVTPAGADAEVVWAAVCRGNPTTTLLTSVDGAPILPVVGATVNGFSAAPAIKDRKALRLMSRSSAFAVAAAASAVRHGGLDATVDAVRFGAFVGAPAREMARRSFSTAVAHATNAHGLQLDRFGRTGLDLVDPLWLLRGLSNAPLYFVTSEHRALGSHGSYPMGGVSASIAIGEAARAIERGDLDVALAGGCDALFEPDRIDMLRAAGLLTRFDRESSAGSRPFDRRRDGMALAEGAGFLLLEERSHAAARIAPVHAQISGYGAAAAPRAADGTASRRGFAAALRAAIDDAGRPAVDGIIAHGLATPSGDREEAAGLAAVFGSRRPPVTAVKGTIGHLGAASGAVEAVLAVLALRHGSLPPIAEHHELDGQCDINCVVGRCARAVRLDTVAISNANFGGLHAALVLQRAA